MIGLIGGMIAGSIISSAANYAIAKENRDWQGEMSSTSHQREVEDLKKAGLNPVLSVNRGASTPVGAMSTVENPMQAATAKMLAYEIKEAKSRIEVNEQSSAKLMADRYLAQANQRVADLNATLASLRIPKESALADVYKKYGKILAPIGVGAPILRDLAVTGGAIKYGVGTGKGLGQLSKLRSAGRLVGRDYPGYSRYLRGR